MSISFNYIKHSWELLCFSFDYFIYYVYALIGCRFDVDYCFNGYCFCQQVISLFRFYFSKENEWNHFYSVLINSFSHSEINKKNSFIVFEINHFYSIRSDMILSIYAFNEWPNVRSFVRTITTWYQNEFFFCLIRKRKIGFVANQNLIHFNWNEFIFEHPWNEIEKKKKKWITAL